VFIDPDSPAGTEYAIPLDQARREAAGGNAGAGSPATGEQPLFGAGVAPRREERQARGGRPRGSARQADPEEAEKARSPGASTPGGSTAAIAAATGDGGSEALLTGAIAAAVLAVGLAAGLAFRKSLGGTR
jgi:hypothetical protein